MESKIAAKKIKEIKKAISHSKGCKIDELKNHIKILEALGVTNRKIEDILLEKDKDGNSTIMKLGERDELKELPNWLLNERVLLLDKNKDGWSAIEAYSEERSCYWVPIPLLKKIGTQRLKNGTTLVNELAVKGDLAKELMEKEFLYSTDAHEDTALHCAAYGQKLKKIPRKFLTGKEMTRENKSGQSVLDILVEQKKEIMILKDLNPKTWIEKDCEKEANRCLWRARQESRSIRSQLKNFVKKIGNYRDLKKEEKISFC